MIQPAASPTPLTRMGSEASSDDSVQFSARVTREPSAHAPPEFFARVTPELLARMFPGNRLSQPAATAASQELSAPRDTAAGWAYRAAAHRDVSGRLPRVAPELAPEVFQFAVDFLDAAVVSELAETLVHTLTPFWGLRLLESALLHPETAFGVRLRLPLLRWVADNIATLRYHPTFLALPRASPVLQALAAAYLPFKADGTDNAPLFAPALLSPAVADLFAWLLPAVDFTCKRTRERAFAWGVIHADANGSVAGYLRAYFALADATPCALPPLPALQRVCARCPEDADLLSAIQRGQGAFAAEELKPAFRQVLASGDFCLVERFLRSTRSRVQEALLEHAYEHQWVSQEVCDRLSDALCLPTPVRGKQKFSMPPQQTSGQSTYSSALEAARRQREHETTLKAAFASGDLPALEQALATSPDTGTADPARLCDLMLTRTEPPVASLAWSVAHLDDAQLDRLALDHTMKLTSVLSRSVETLLSVILRLQKSPVARRGMNGSVKNGVHVSAPPIAVQKLLRSWAQMATRTADLGGIEQVIDRLPEALREDLIEEFERAEEED